jgi:hypothetical protein
MTRRSRTASAGALAVLLAVLALAANAGYAAAGSPKLKVAPAEARSVTKQALAQTAALIDARKVVVKDCKLSGSRARCYAIMRGARQTLRATVAIRELPDDYLVRVLRME